jgi:Domain of unknown function (DUF4333)
MAMAAVVLGVLVPVLGIALGSAAVRRDARTREGGRTLAWIGIVIGTALTMCLVGVGVALVVHTPSVATQTLEARVVARTGSVPDEVRCPDRLPAQLGGSVTCTVTDNRGSLPVRVAVTAVNPDGTVSFEITG